ncbi:MAG TPA: CRISPR-associated endonuclease Cas3'', partial [Thermomicrobiales bacterium]|nr:CRISPR-associated endonuclease Cas3'' [Thermomicrobiales bacterium]
MKANPALLALWAKTDRSGKDPDAWHPLICHMLDVAAVARAMWREVLTPALRRRITDGLGLPDEAAAEAWIAYLAGLHDLGKGSPGFQAKWPEARDRLTDAGLTPGHPENDPGHG